jgi:hypothetical protein
MTQTSIHGAQASKTVRPRDIRSGYRRLLASVAPLPLVAKGIYYLLTAVPGDASFADTVAAYQAHRELLGTLRWLDIVFVCLLTPAVLAVILVSRRGAPRLTFAGGVISLLGCFVGFGLLGGIETPELMTARYGLDPAAMSKLRDAMEGNPVMMVAGLLFIVGIVFGLGLLGAALWRSRAVPAWAGIALLLGGATHPFLPNQLAQGAGLLVGAVGFAAGAVALLRQANDTFDLPPLDRQQ